MIEKDEEKLKEIFLDDYYLTHMSGRKQDKDDFIDEIMNGTYEYTVRFFTQKNTVTAVAASSATIREYQMPSRPKIIGSSITAAIWQITVRTKEITADTRPLFRAVNMELPKKLNPLSRKDRE